MLQAEMWLLLEASTDRGEDTTVLEYILVWFCVALRRYMWVLSSIQIYEEDGMKVFLSLLMRDRKRTRTYNVLFASKLHLVFSQFQRCSLYGKCCFPVNYSSPAEHFPEDLDLVYYLFQGWDAAELNTSREYCTVYKWLPTMICTTRYTARAPWLFRRAP